MKQCLKCKKLIELSGFGNNKSKKDGKEPYCKACRKLKYKENREEILQAKKLYYQENKESLCRDKMYYYQENKEEIKKKQAVYRKDNPHIFAKIGAKRRARKINQTPTDLSTLESSMIEALYFMSRVLSKSCGEPFHIDHITPLSKGGQHKFDNLQILSAEQNLRKGNR